MIAEREVEVLLGRARERIKGLRDHRKVITGEEAIPNGVGFGGGPEDRRHQTESARVSRTGQRYDIRYAAFW